MIRIIIDSSSDFQLEEATAKNMDLVSLSVIVGEDSYLDGVNLDRDVFYKNLAETTEFPKTSQPSPQAFLDIFLNAKEKGDDVICILLSSALSGTCQSAVLAKNMADYDNIYIVDSLSATCSIRILADHACELRDKGYSAAEIVDVLENLKSRVKIAAALNTLEYLYRGGRLSKTAATIGELASLKPMITVTEEGTIGILGKSLGKNKAIASLLKYIQSQDIDTDYPLYTVYTYGTDNCTLFEERLAEAGIHPTARMQVGPTIGTHVGPEVFGLVYVNAAQK